MTDPVPTPGQPPAAPRDTHPSTTPPPVPPGAARRPIPGGESSTTSDEVYNIMADKVGFVPNVRRKDNLFQGIVVLTLMIIGAVTGALIDGYPMAAGLAAGGLIVGVIVSGTVLCIIGLFRKSTPEE